MQKYGVVNLIAGLIAVLIFFVIGVNLVPTVANAQAAATSNANVTGAANALTQLVSVIFVALIIIKGVSFMG
jgi:hypothetical protein